MVDTINRVNNACEDDRPTFDNRLITSIVNVVRDALMSETVGRVANESDGDGGQGENQCQSTC